jgi:uncharacterized protein (DUF885 family)
MAVRKILLGLALFLCGCTPRATTNVANDSAAKLKTLKDDWWQFFLRENPENASVLGEYKYNDKLSNISLAHVPEVRQEASNLLARVEAVEIKTLSDTDQLDQALLTRTLADQIQGIDLKNYEMPVDQINGLQITLPQITTYAPFDSVKHYEDYIARLKQIPATLDQAIAVMRQGELDGLMPPKYLLEKAADQTQKIAEPAGDKNPFTAPATKFPDAIAAADRKRLHDEMVSVVDQQVRPAYRNLRKFLAEDYAPKGRKDPGIWALPDGDKRYLYAVHFWTTSSKTPEQIHQIGLSQVAEFTKDIDELAKKAGAPDGRTYRNMVLKDPKYMAKSREQILNAYRDYIARMEAKLPQLFGRLPKAKLIVTSVPEYMEKENPTQYITGTPDGSRPGQVWVNTYDPTHHNIDEDESTAYHEGIPGHHMQIAIALELQNQHPFHRGLFFSAFDEGWALYAERLGKEVGFYQDPASDLGRLQSEIFRAVRLVVDTGVHAKHWTREQMIQYFKENYGDPSEAEVDRYIAWPGQALGYKLGQLQMIELREKAQAGLGAKFDIKAFHDEILGAGPLPLEVLDARVRRWIEMQKKQNAR